MSLFFAACKKETPQPERLDYSHDLFISGADISQVPEIRERGITFFHEDGQQDEFTEILRLGGINTIRLRLWVNPAEGRSGFEEVKAFSKELKQKGFKILLSVHYSDTWADPGQQRTPQAWQNLSFDILKDSMVSYTDRIMRDIQPDIIQIGNEINPGLLHPQGHINQGEQMLELLSAACTAVRAHNDDTKIMIHYAGISGSQFFFNRISSLDYDYLGISYYPIWHGKDISMVENTLNNLAQTHNKEVVIVETAYPFTLEWNDFTNNIVGLPEQLILPEFPATKEGQLAFMTRIRDIVLNNERIIGFCYWGAELIAWKGPEATDGSPWENQALFDFTRTAVPALRAFRAE